MRFSIIIPTRNRPASLDRCLAAIGQLKYPLRDVEVLVADDGSQPPVDAVVTRHATSLLSHVYLSCDGRGPARARNEALWRAHGDYVVFTDDDCTPAADWLTMFDRAYTEWPDACLGGKVMDDPANGICGTASQLLVSYLYEHGAGGTRFFCSNNFAFPREALIAMNGFDVSFPLAAAEDRDLCARWASRAELRFVDGAVVFHRQKLNASSFCRQHFRYGRGAYAFWLRRRNEGSGGRRLESWAFYMRMLMYPFHFMPFPKALVVSALLAISQIACGAGYFVERVVRAGAANSGSRTA